jgi:hypothetical protein
MISAKVIELIEIHAGRLARDVAQDLATNERTPGFVKVPPEELEIRTVAAHEGTKILGQADLRRNR